ncbi:serine hydrolase domain-containing protein [Solicola gregarius]|uniref:Beta-lactamase family protein n=1 Tax=Solicola gregarius TaxID=2908642 RepID=A0AA46TFI4_9ACTN|nr:serine hydrolase domain-containing protein [Solicola gregarius]UYM04161.1 beta-lactamase family protein [Solicola gregarius]
MRRTARTAVAAALAAALLGGTAADVDAGTGRAPDDRVRHALDRLMDGPNAPEGAFVLVQKGGHSRAFRAGVADVTTGRPITRGMHMRIASTAKAYSGAVVLSLVERGVLKLGDTIGERLPWAPRAWRRVTLRQALHHTSGLPDFSATKKFRTYLLAHLDKAPGHRRLLGFAAHKPLEFRPGSRFGYSNSDNVVAALMVEDATGRSYESVLARRVLRPLRLHNTSLPRGTFLRRPRIHGYDRDDGALVDVTSVFAAGYAWASGGMVSTPRDQNRFIRGYVGRALFDGETQSEQFTFRRGHSEPPGPGTNTAGLAVFRYRTPCGTVYGHTGNTAGYTQFMAASKNGRTSAVVSVNAQITPDTKPAAFHRLRTVFRTAVCAAFATHAS